MEKHKIYDAINDALVRSRKLNPSWPDHVCAQAAKVSAASGELMKDSLNMKFKKGANDLAVKMTTQKLEASAIETIVQGIRFLENLK